MQKSDLSVVQHSTFDLREVSLELRLFIETLACSSCQMSARSSQLSADSERQIQKYRMPASRRYQTRQAFCLTMGASDLQ